MEKIGEKIKRIRKANGWSQDAVLPEHQSLVSQIEKGGGKGGIMNPGRGTLEKIAKNMKMSINELIEDTDWDPTKETSSTNEYAFSRTEATVSLDESGEIKILMKAYPLYNDKGEENKYSPETGARLYSKCEHKKRNEDGKMTEEPCGRSIESPTQRSCMACGYPLLPFIGENLPKLKTDFWYSLDANTEEIDRVSLWIENRRNEWSEAHELARYSPKEGGAPGSSMHAYFELGDRFGLEDGLDGSEFVKGQFSNDSRVVQVWDRHEYTLSVLTGLLYELKRWNAKIVSEEVEPPPVKGNDKDGPDIPGFLKSFEDEPF